MIDSAKKSLKPIAPLEGNGKAVSIALDNGLVFTGASRKRLRKGWGAFILDPAEQKIDACLAMSGSISMARDILVAEGVIPEWVSARRLGEWLAQRKRMR